MRLKFGDVYRTCDAFSLCISFLWLFTLQLFCQPSLALQLQDQQRTPGSIVGRVYQSDGRTGVPNATVVAVPVAPLPGEQAVTKSATTDATGLYRIPDLPPGLYTLTASASGYQTVTKPNVRVDPATTVTVDIILPPQPGVVEGVVVRDDDGKPIADALVEAVQGGVVASSARTASSGIFTLINVPAGSVEIRVSATGYLSQSKVVEVPSGGVVTGVSFRLIALPFGGLSGLVTRLIDGSVAGGVRVEVTDTLGKVVASAVTSPQAGEEDGYRFNYRVSLPSGTYNVRIASVGYVADEKRNVGVLPGRETKGINFSVRAFMSFKPKLHMMSLPFDYSRDGLNAAQVFGMERIKLATWLTDVRKPLGGEYAYFDPTNINSPAYAFQIGRGYFLKAETNLDFTREGMPANTNYRFPIKLEVGWNLIGAPFTFTVDWLRTYVKPQNMEAMPITDPRARAFVNIAIWTLREEWGGAETVFGYYQMATTLEPFKAYWVYALQPVEILIDNQPVQGAISRQRKFDGAVSVLRACVGDGWLIRVKLLLPTGVDGDNFIGVAKGANDGVDFLDVPKPPPPCNYKVTTLSFAQDQANGRVKLSVDLRSQLTQKQIFNLLIEGDTPSPATLVFEPIGELPKDLNVTLIDMRSGVTVDALAQRSYSFTIGSEGTRLMKLIVSRYLRSQLRILNLRQLPTRGDSVLVGFTLTQPACIGVRVMTLTGRTIMMLEPSKIYGAGENRLAIKLPSTLPRGLYVLCATAVDPNDGRRFNAFTRLKY